MAALSPLWSAARAAYCWAARALRMSGVVIRSPAVRIVGSALRQGRAEPTTTERAWGVQTC